MAYRSSGWSCHPRIHANDLCYVSPVNREDDLQVDDIVFCLVQPGDRFFAHPILAMDWQWCTRTKRHEYCFTIGNLEGRTNGYVYFDGIYGKFDYATH